MTKRLLRPEKQMWRTGRKVGRTIYAMIGLLPADTDMLIGVMDTKALAQEAVSAHNHGIIQKAADRRS